MFSRRRILATAIKVTQSSFGFPEEINCSDLIISVVLWNVIYWTLARIPDLKYG